MKTVLQKLWKGLKWYLNYLRITTAILLPSSLAISPYILAERIDNYWYCLLMIVTIPVCIGFMVWYFEDKKNEIT